MHRTYARYSDVDPTVHPASEVKGGSSCFGIESTEDASIWYLMIALFNSVDGTITLKKRDEDARMKELKFEAAQVVALSENLDNTGGTR